MKHKCNLYLNGDRLDPTQAISITILESVIMDKLKEYGNGSSSEDYAHKRMAGEINFSIFEITGALGSLKLKHLVTQTADGDFKVSAGAINFSIEYNLPK